MEQTTILEMIKEEIKEIKEKMVTKEDFESIIETWEILHNEETMEQIRQSEKEIAEGKVRFIRNVKDIIKEG